MPFTLGAGAAFGTVMAAYRYTQGFTGYNDLEGYEDEVARKEALRKIRRRPIEETVEQLGEGRGKTGSRDRGTSKADISRYLRSRLRREEATKAAREVRSRCGSSTDELDTSNAFLGVQFQTFKQSIREAQTATDLCTYQMKHTIAESSRSLSYGF